MPGDAKTLSNVVLVPIPESQFPSGVHSPIGGHVPDVVECVPLTQTQWTVSPTRIEVVFVPLVWSTNEFAPPDPMFTVATFEAGVAVGLGAEAGVGVIVATPGVTVGVPGPVVGVAVTMGGPVAVFSP